MWMVDVYCEKEKGNRIVVQQYFEKVGCNIYGSCRRYSHKKNQPLFPGFHVESEGGRGLYMVLYGI